MSARILGALRENLLAQFSAASLGAVVIFAVAISALLSQTANHQRELIQAHGAAMMDGSLQPSDPHSVPNIIRDLEEHRIRILVTLSGGFALLYAGLVGIVWRGWRTIQIQQAALARSNEEARSARQRLDLILRSAGEGIYGLDLEGKATFVNPAAAALLGWEIEDLVGRPMHSAVHTAPNIDMPLAEECAICNAARARTPRRIDGAAFWKKDGSQIPVDCSVTPIEEEGQWVGNVVVFRDITDQERAEQEMRNTVSLLRATLESTADGILVVDTEGRIVRFNQKFAEMWRIPHEVLSSKSDDEALAFVLDQLADPEGFLAKVRELYANPEADSLDTLEFQDGRVFRRFSQPQRVGGKVVGRVWSFRDITEREKAEAALRESEERYRLLAGELEERVEERTLELQQAQEELVRKERLAVLGELAGSVSHELRNPLGAMKNSVYFLSAVLQHPAEKVQKHLNLLRREIDRSNQIISDLLEYARPKPPSLAPHDPAHVVEQVLSQTETPPNVRVTISLPADLPPVPVDLDQMHHVFGNLLINAVQAMPDGGEISLGASHRDGHVTFSVHDTGKGISPQDMERIFEPLFSTKVRGTGLGLSIARIILEGHRGQIWAESDGKTGSTFFVKLPSADGGIAGDG